MHVCYNHYFQKIFLFMTTHTAALVQQNLLQCPFVCESMPTPEMRCARSSDCTFQGLKCCPNACGQGRICTRPVSRATVMGMLQFINNYVELHEVMLFILCQKLYIVHCMHESLCMCAHDAFLSISCIIHVEYFHCFSSCVN